MEKFHLPVLSENPFVKTEKREKELPVEFKIAKAFLFQKYPLSEAGEQLREKVESIVKTLKSNPTDPEALENLKKISADLPTVESPHLDLFANLEVSPEDEKEVFGLDLRVVQVTKGCRHQCEHCAAAADKKVQVMPFAAVLKIAEKAELQLKELEHLEAQVKQTLTDFDGNQEIQSLASSIKSELGDRHGFESMALLLGHPKMEVAQRIEQLFSLLEELPAIKRAMGLFQLKKFESLPNILENGFKQRFLNYYDSDPFDYRDTTFLHKDGTPADYGDVVESLWAERRQIEFTTAGWPKDDAIAQRAAEKIALLPKNALISPRISLHPYETGTSKNNPAAYAAYMENVFSTLAPIKPMVGYLETVFKPEHEAYLPVLKELYAFAKAKSLEVYGHPGYSVLVSRYSGRAAEEFGQKDKDHDVMSCMPGIHILPDGSVARQDETSIYYKKGTRPQLLGKKIFTLKK